MRKLFVMALAIALFMSLGATSALATGGGGDDGNGKPCNPNSPAGQAGSPHHPGCNDPGNGNGNGNGCKDKDKNDKHKCPPGHGCKPHHDNCEVPEGNCKEADLVLFEPARIVCLYFGEKAPLASKLGDCPDALITGGGGQGDLALGLCVFLPPDTDENGGTPGLPELPGGGLPGLPGLPGGGGDDGNGKPCNPNSPAGQAGSPHHPGCNDPGNGNGCKDKDKNDKHKCPPGHGCKPHHDNCEVPEGNCKEADLVLFEPARIVCLYFGANAANASKLGDCPDALIAGGGGQGDLGLGVCVFLPPDTDENGGTPGLPGLPGLPGGGGGTPGLPELPGLPGK